uniref:Polyprotein n=1 Tax=Cajanus cajan TaxID=3821 RepID=A0A151SNU6_CAJCA|nr:polyprotein [Cajanus cajan]
MIYKGSNSRHSVDRPTINIDLTKLDINSKIARPIYENNSNIKLEEDFDPTQSQILNTLTRQETFNIDKKWINEDFNANYNKPLRERYFSTFTTEEVINFRTLYYSFIEENEINIYFFDWFEKYSRENNIIKTINPLTRTIKIWKTINNKIHTSEYPPTSTVHVSILTEDYSGFRKSSINTIDDISLNKMKTIYPKTRTYYPRPSLADVLYEERGELIQNSYSGSDICEWNIDGMSEQNILDFICQMSMAASVYKRRGNSDKATAMTLIQGFTGQLKGWWDNFWSPADREAILNAVKQETREEDAVATLIYTIIQHFVGDPNTFKDRAASQLANLYCPTMSDYRWYKDVFMSKITLRGYGFQGFWKERLLPRLHKLFSEKVKMKLENHFGNPISYHSLTYGQIHSIIIETGIQVCNDFKLQNKLRKEVATNKKEIGNFYEQYGVEPIRAPSAVRRKTQKGQTHNQNSYKKQTYKKHKKIYTNKTYSEKPNTISKPNRKPSQKKNITCWKYGRTGHFANKCKIQNKINELEIDESLKKTLITIMINFESEESDSTSDEESNTEIIYQLEEEDSNSSQEDECCLGPGLCTCTDYKTINMLTSEQTHTLIDLISQLENEKGLIRNSKSPWSCLAFYVMNAAEQERGAPRLVINYKPLNKVLKWIRYPLPNKQDLIKRLNHASIFSKFVMKSGSSPKPQNIPSPSKQISKITPPVDTPTGSYSYQEDYVQKDHDLDIIIVEPEWKDLSPSTLATKLFTDQHHYPPYYHKRLFYEFILVDTDSIELTHTKDELGSIQFSKVKIQKILAPSDWNQPLCQGKSFSREFQPQHYTYYDYMLAWTNILYLQPKTHSWFFWFRRGISLKFPKWFLQWFQIWGPIREIFPPEVSEYYDYFKSKTTFQQSYRLISFVASQNITWIATWDYLYRRSNEESPRILTRNVKVKWWKKFDTKLLSKKRIDEWTRNSSLTTIKTSTHDKELSDQEVQFLVDKRKIMAELASATSQEEFEERLKLIQSLQDGSQAEETGSSNSISTNPYLRNEDMFD